MNAERQNCLVLKEKRKNFLQELDYEAGWGKTNKFSFITGTKL